MGIPLWQIALPFVCAAPFVVIAYLVHREEKARKRSCEEWVKAWKEWIKKNSGT